jgi:hypothetical protein
MKLSNLMLKLTKPLLTRAESEAIAVFRLIVFAVLSVSLNPRDSRNSGLLAQLSGGRAVVS